LCTMSLIEFSVHRHNLQSA